MGSLQLLIVVLGCQIAEKDPELAAFNPNPFSKAVTQKQGLLSVDLPSLRRLPSQLLLLSILFFHSSLLFRLCSQKKNEKKNVLLIHKA